MSHILNIYSTFDRKAQNYIAIFTVRSDVEAIRSFTDAVMTSETPISQYPADFDLHRMGAVDLESGEITPEYPPYPVVNGLVCLTQAHQERSRYQRLLQQPDGSVSAVEQPQAS